MAECFPEVLDWTVFVQGKCTALSTVQGTGQCTVTLLTLQALHVHGCQRNSPLWANTGNL